MRTKILTTLFFSALLAACASGVKLDEVPVEDRSATSPGTTLQGQPIASAAQTSVSSVISEKSSNGIGPIGVEHVVFFDYDSFVVRADARPVIENHARFLQANKQRKANLEGHTDERGGREYNLALGQKRAEAVRQALALLGVSDTQLEAVSYGKEKPAAPGSAESDLAKNRRVEIRY
jgi:peptidoglycan-associated lipoprotein